MIDTIVVLVITAPAWIGFFYTVFLFAQFFYNVIFADDTDDWPRNG
jgi:hypothetical protein